MVKKCYKGLTCTHALDHEKSTHIKCVIVHDVRRFIFLERGGKFPLREVLPYKLQQRVI